MEPNGGRSTPTKGKMISLLFGIPVTLWHDCGRVMGIGKPIVMIVGRSTCNILSECLI